MTVPAVCIFLPNFILISAACCPCEHGNHKFDQIWNIWELPYFFTYWGNLAWESEPMVCSSVPYFTWKGASCHTCMARNLKFDQFWNIWGLRTNFRYQWGKFGMLQWTCDMLYMPNFCALINASYHPCHVRNCKFDRLLNSGGSIITPSLIRVDLWEWTCSMLLHTEFYLDWCIMSHLMGEKLQIWPHFQIQYSMMMPSSGAEAEMNVHAQLQTFSCLTT